MPPKKDDSTKVDLSWASQSSLSYITLDLLDMKIWVDTEGDPSGECYKTGFIVKVVDNNTL
jgi:hypothetical protein